MTENIDSTLFCYFRVYKNAHFCMMTFPASCWHKVRNKKFLQAKCLYSICRLGLVKSFNSAILRCWVTPANQRKNIHNRLKWCWGCNYTFGWVFAHCGRFLIGLRASSVFLLYWDKRKIPNLLGGDFAGSAGSYFLNSTAKRSFCSILTNTNSFLARVIAT